MKKIAGLLAVLLLAVSAQAAMQISYQIDGGAVVTCATVASSGPASCATVFGTVDIIGLLASSNSPGNATKAKEVSTTAELTNNDSVSHTVAISIASQDFALPVTPPDITLLSHVGGTVLTGSGLNVLSYQSCVDTSNGLNTVSGGIAT